MVKTRGTNENKKVEKTTKEDIQKEKQTDIHNTEFENRSDFNKFRKDVHLLDMFLSNIGSGKTTIKNLVPTLKDMAEENGRGLRIKTLALDNDCAMGIGFKPDDFEIPVYTFNIALLKRIISIIEKCSPLLSISLTDFYIGFNPSTKDIALIFSNDEDIDVCFAIAPCELGEGE